MARRAPDLIVEAFLRTSVREDQLGEMFAHLLANDDRVLETILNRIGAPGAIEREVAVQRVTPGGRRVDIELRLLKRGRPVHVVWFELKEWAREQPEQLRDYARDLAWLYPMSSTLVALAPSDHDVLRVARTVEPPAIPLSWQEIAVASDKVARLDYGSRWRETARDPATPASQRVLLEFLRLLHRRGVAISMDPLTLVDVLAANRLDALLGKTGSIATLLDGAAGQVAGYQVDEAAGWPGAQLSAWHGRILRPTDAEQRWPLSNPAWNGACWLVFKPTDVGFLSESDARDQPVFVGGFGFDPVPADFRRLIDADEWTEQLPSDFRVADKGRSVEMGKWVYMSEVVTWGGTLSEQAEKLGAWATASLSAIAGLPSPAAPDP